MRSITLVLQSQADAEEQEEILERVRGLAGICQAQSFSPHSKVPSVRRLCYATVEDDADLDTLLSRVSSLTGVEKAELPADRRLIEKK
jgi:hypothetical protein